MKKLILSAILVLAAIGTSTRADDTPTTLLGSRYISVGGNFTQLNDTDNLYSAGASINIPIILGLAANASYEYAWPSGDTSNDLQTALVGATFHIKLLNFRPFIGADIGYTWGANSAKTTIYQGHLGAEFTFLGRLSLLGYASYLDGASNDFESKWKATAQASFWLTKKFALSARASYLESGNTSYGTSALFRF